MQNQVDAFIRERNSYRSPGLKTPSRNHKHAVPARQAKPAVKTYKYNNHADVEEAPVKKIPKLPTVTLSHENAVEDKKPQVVNHLKPINSIDGFGAPVKYHATKKPSVGFKMMATKAQKPTRLPKVETVEVAKKAPRAKSFAELMQAELEADLVEAISMPTSSVRSTRGLMQAVEVDSQKIVSHAPKSMATNFAHPKVNFNAMEDAFDSILESSANEASLQAGAVAMPVAKPFMPANNLKISAQSIEAVKNISNKILDFSPQVAYMAGAAVLGIGLVIGSVSVDSREANGSANASQPVNSISTKIEIPQQTQVVNAGYLNSHVVKGDEPKTIAINGISVSARVLNADLDDKGNVSMPLTGQDVNWYTGSHKPGEFGASLMTAHSISKTGDAVFSKIGNLKAGDNIIVERGDGKLFTYAVKATAKIPANAVNLKKLTTSIDSNKPGLNLMAPAGDYNSEAKTFSARQLVFAVEI